jgi:TRAP-type C4-dicarboxylate transport system permease small subunit
MRTFVLQVCDFMSVIAGAVLVFMVCLTFTDVVMRFFGRPVPGVYEVIAYLGVAVTGFALPRASMQKAHVYVDLVIDKMSAGPRKVFRVFTRIVVFLLFLVAAWYFVQMGKSFIATRSVTMTLRIPFYPVVFGLTVCCLAQCLVSLYEMFEKEGGESNE